MMPVVDGIGCSEFTFEKQDIFDGIIDMHTSIVKAIIGRGKVAPAYYYFDLTAGAGVYQDDQHRWIIGSPMRMIQHLTIKNMDYYTTFYELSKQSEKKLQGHLGTYWMNPRSVIDIQNTDYGEILKVVFRETKIKYGLIYVDTNATIPPFQLWASLSELADYRCIDFMTTYAATSHKRQLKSDACHANERLPELLSKINKKHWLIREPVGRHQWTFLIGTNWADFPQWNKQHFYDITTTKGREIYKMVSMTKAEQGLLDI